VPNVSLARETSNPAVYLIIGAMKFWIVDQAEFDALGFRWSKVLVVEDGALGHLPETRLHAPPRTRPSDVFFDCGQDFSSITGRWHFNCQSSTSIVQREVLAAGWLYRPNPAEDPDQPFVNIADHGIEDIHYNLLLDAVFLHRMYGPDGLSSRLVGATYSGNPPDAQPLPFAAAPPLDNGLPTTASYNSWILPGNTYDLHGELNAWHRNNTGGIFTRHFVGRGDPPAHWVNPFPPDDGAYFPFHPLNPDSRERNLRTGDYILVRGPLWEDQWHGDPTQVQAPWDTGPTRHHAWLEMHPIDWIVRLQPPAANARLTAARVALCTPDATSPQLDWGTSITPGFPPSAPSRRLEVRTVERLDDHRIGMIVPGSLRGIQTNRQADRVDVSVSVAPVGSAQGRYKGSWLVGWSELDQRDRPWIDDGLPGGSQEHGDNEGWNWVSLGPAPFHGTIAHQSVLAPGMHQHYFLNQTSTLPVGQGDVLFATVYLDPVSPPDEVMLQWHTTGWLHRAYWGADRLGWGTPGTNERRPMGRLPFSGEWVRLEVPAAAIGLEGATVTGMAFSLFGGRATWDYAGVRVAVPKSGQLAASVSPSVVAAGTRTVTVHARDSGDRSPVAGRVLLDGQDITSTNTAFTKRFTAEQGLTESVEFVVRCPAYPEATAILRVRGPQKPGNSL
jgi:hypothetical protein